VIRRDGQPLTHRSCVEESAKPGSITFQQRIHYSAAFVSVKNWLRKPIKPLDGMRNSMLTLPLPLFTRLSNRPLRTANFSVIFPINSSGISRNNLSTGSTVLPFCSLVMTCGGKPLIHNLRGAWFQLILPFAIHRARKLQRSWFSQFLYFDGNISQRFFFQPLQQMAWSEKFTFFAGEGTVVDIKNHRYSWLIDQQTGQRLWRYKRRNCIANSDIFHSGQSNNISGLSDSYRFFCQTIKSIKSA